MDVLSVRRRTRFHLVGHCAAHRRCRRQAVWNTLSRYLIWANSAVATDWWFFRRVARGNCDHALRQLSLDVVCGCFVGCHSRLMQSTDSRTKDCTPRSSSLSGPSVPGSRSVPKSQFVSIMMIRISVIVALLLFSACAIQKKAGLNDGQSQGQLLLFLAERAIQDEWQEILLRGATEYRLTASAGRIAIRAIGQDSASGLVRRVQVNPVNYPRFEWSWRVDHF